MKATSHVAKTYVVKVAGTPAAEGLERLRRGLLISSESKFHPKGLWSNNRKPERVKTAPAKIRLVRESDNPWYEVTLTEGRNRQIRRMFEEIGHHVEKIKRVRYGPLSLDVPPGEFRRLSAGEVEKLKAAAGLSRGSTGRDPLSSFRAGGHVFRKNTKRRTGVSDPH